MTWYDLSAFVDQREQLLEESFQALSPDELGILTPVELQHIPMEELKALCLDQLHKLPNERVLAILQDPLVKLLNPGPREDSVGPSRLQGLLGHRVQNRDNIEKEYRDISTMCTTAQMEILELELRARAIRSLMQAQGQKATSSSSPSSSKKQQ
ncbi:uncharacterized protein LOC120849861 [Ixodes scapularis]|uniref:uncharacterized protein LOC120849861 n=1 Tax=Ixodes scapularis TaxID=6945 RepID=UPI001A9E952F|nr:uncharacterized protein LOC120849861 [Ixodes scapularis]